MKAYFFVGSVLFFANSRIILAKQEIFRIDGHRELTVTDSVCSRVLEAQVLGSVKCTCDSSSLGQFEFKCSTFNKVCDPLGVVCGFPSVQGVIGVTTDSDDVNVEFQGAVCVANLSLGSQQLLSAPLCLQFPVEPNTSGGSLLTNWINAILGLVEGKDPPEAKASSVDCVAMIGETECLSCTKCEGSGGYTFDCSNLNSGIVASTCEPVQLITSLNGKKKSVGLFLPKLYGAVRRF